ncbi:hypothetical protein NDU88_004769 [Pleurodeles waltl]|uniref:Uncharacterized protein n=1 Tax=Pleurodeles waltl TaxID=8319 RepID=A0AAV7W8U2_PLEWA|nr:hypothetical protein NDU88_004769 [Pleurodeles waltl]
MTRRGGVTKRSASAERRREESDEEGDRDEEREKGDKEERERDEEERGQSNAEPGEWLEKRTKKRQTESQHDDPTLKHAWHQALNPEDHVVGPKFIIQNNLRHDAEGRSNKEVGVGREKKRGERRGGRRRRGMREKRQRGMRERDEEERAQSNAEPGEWLLPSRGEEDEEAADGGLKTAVALGGGILRPAMLLEKRGISRCVTTPY